MKTPPNLAAILLTAYSFSVAQDINTISALKATISNYGLSATEFPIGEITVTGTKADATTPLVLNTGATDKVIWKADLTGSIPDCLVCNNGSGNLYIDSGRIVSIGTNGVPLANTSKGTINIKGGIVANGCASGATDTQSISAPEECIAVKGNSVGTITLSNTPNIYGRIYAISSNPISVDNFAPNGNTYFLEYDHYASGMTVVKNGGNFLSNFQTVNIPEGLTTAASGNDLILTALSPILPALTLENLPKNTKVEIYTLQGKRIYSVQTKGIYIVKIGNQTKKIFLPSTQCNPKI